jgi:phospholipid/cholesterol/gamma-HCH transport system substrate-binding protein
LLSFILLLGGDKSFFRKNILLHVNFEETGGLAVGSVVQIAGIPAGNVKSIDFDGDKNLLNVTLKLDSKYLPRLTKGTTAALRTQGALGDKYIWIRPGALGGEVVKDGDHIDADEGNDFMTTLGKSGTKVEKAFAILDQLEKMVHEMNDRRLATNMAEAARNLRETSASVNEIMATVKTSDVRNNRVKAAIDHLASILEKVDNGQGTLGSLINDPTVHEDLKSLLGGAKRSKLLKYLIRQTIKKNDEAEDSGPEESAPKKK